MKAELTGWKSYTTGGFAVTGEDGTLIASFIPVTIAWGYLRNGTFYDRAKEATEKVVSSINSLSEFLDEDVIASSGIKAGVPYRHFKGGVYTVMGFARSSENPSSTLVLYHKPDRPSEMWARPIEMWFERVADGITRFTEITEGVLE